MYRLFALLTIGILGPLSLIGSEAPQLQFEVASIKPAAPLPGGGYHVIQDGGPGTSSPGECQYRGMTLRDLLKTAYGVERQQISGPSWLDDNRFDIAAKVSRTTIRRDLPEMLQSLLALRFGLKVHHESRPSEAYVLTVAKGGSKLKLSHAAAPDQVQPPNANSESPGPAMPKFTVLKNGCPSSLGQGMLTNVVDGRLCVSAVNVPISSLIRSVLARLGVPVVDETHLTGKYDFDLTFALESFGAPSRSDASTGSQPAGIAAEPHGPDLIESLKAQLGLDLQLRHVPLDCIVVDHVERTPTEN